MPSVDLTADSALCCDFGFDDAKTCIGAVLLQLLQSTDGGLFECFVH